MQMFKGSVLRERKTKSGVSLEQIEFSNEEEYNAYLEKKFTNANEVKKVVPNLMYSLKEMSRNAKDFFEDKFDKLSTYVSDKFENIENPEVKNLVMEIEKKGVIVTTNTKMVLNNLYNKFNSGELKDDVVDLGEDFYAFIKEAFTDVKENTSKYNTNIKDFVEKVKEKNDENTIKNFFNKFSNVLKNKFDNIKNNVEEFMKKDETETTNINNTPDNAFNNEIDENDLEIPAYIRKRQKEMKEKESF